MAEHYINGMVNITMMKGLNITLISDVVQFCKMSLQLVKMTEYLILILCRLWRCGYLQHYVQDQSL
jgi:hypothetical protein